MGGGAMISALLRKWFSHEQTTQERPGIPEGIARGAVAGSVLGEPVAGVDWARPYRRPQEPNRNQLRARLRHNQTETWPGGRVRMRRRQFVTLLGGVAAGGARATR